MKPTNTVRVAQALQLAALVAIACSSAALAHAQSRTRTVTLEPGTVIAVKLDQALSSNDSRKGEKFTATLADDQKNNSAYGLPEGTQVEGIVRTAQPQKDKHAGVLELNFQRLMLPDGRSYSINGSLIGLDNKSVTKDKNGRLVANKAHRTDRLTFVGYGAGAGLLVGLLTDRKNTLRDTLLGAGLGYLYGSLEKSYSNPRNVTLKEGTKLGVRLDRRLTYAGAVSTIRR